MPRTTHKPAKRKKGYYYRNCKRKLFRGYERVPCLWCKKPVSFWDATVDHIQSLSRGGSNNISNLVISCEKCNQERNEIEQYLRDWHKVRAMEKTRTDDQDVLLAIRKRWRSILRRRAAVYRLVQKFKWSL